MADKYTLIGAVHFVSVILLVKAVGNILPLFSACYYHNIIDLIVGAAVAAQTFRFTKKFYLSETITSKNKAVLITGCDSGFGNLLAKRLHSKGFQVFACCLFPNGEGAVELTKNCPNNLKVVELDVTNDESVKQAAEYVKNNLDNNELWAIVNNAGISVGTSVEFSPLEDFQRCVDVNVYGVIRMIKAFLPFLKKSKGRIVNMTSAAGRLTMPHFSPYCVSKFAAVSLNESIRREIDVWKVRVISIEPDFFNTKLFDKNAMEEHFDKTFSALNQDIQNDYGEKYVREIKEAKDFLLKLNSSKFERVINALDSAITLKHPDIVYKPRGSLLTRFLAIVFLSCNEYLQDLLCKLTNIIVRFPKPKAAVLI